MLGDFGVRYLEASSKTPLVDDYVQRRREIAKALYPGDKEDVALCKLEYRLETGCELNLQDPKTFGEKIHYIKLFDRNPLYPTIVDKYSVRKFVSERIGDEYLNELYFSTTTNEKKIDLDKLPSDFIVKASHGWNMNSVVKGPIKQHEYSQIAKKFDGWLTYDHSRIHAEWAYGLATPRLLFEKYLGENIADYKVYCFGGQARFVKVDANRNDEQTTLYLDIGWQPLPFGNPRVRRPKSIPPPPTCLSEILVLSERLARDLRFVRIDFYEIQERPLFGEMTLYPSGGNIWFSPEEWNVSVGHLVDLLGI